MNLNQLKAWTFDVFNKLYLSPLKEGFQINFSGGKDSHVALGTYLQWEIATGKRLPNLKVVFVDTLLEAPSIYELVDGVEKVCQLKGLPFIRTRPKILDNFWVKLFGFGYPVPYWGARWCTGKMKIDPLRGVGGVAIAGSHMGESTTRDTRLKGCGSSECGIDMIEHKIEPIAPWRNCDVWDWIMQFADSVLYLGAAEKLSTIYDISDSADGSLRMGCFMCPVVKFASIVKQVEMGIIPEFSLAIRNLIEKLRVAPRITSPQRDKAGAILVDARIEIWREMQPYLPELKAYGWISDGVIAIIEDMLEYRTYPPTYTLAWIRQEEPLAKPWEFAFEDAQFMMDSTEVEAIERETETLVAQLKTLNTQKTPLVMLIEDSRYYRSLGREVPNLLEAERRCQELDEAIASLESQVRVKRQLLANHIPPI